MKPLPRLGAAMIAAIGLAGCSELEYQSAVADHGDHTGSSSSSGGGVVDTDTNPPGDTSVHDTGIVPTPTPTPGTDTDTDGGTAVVPPVTGPLATPPF